MDAVRLLEERDASLLVIGDCDSPMFPEELKPYRTRSQFGSGSMKVNFLVNYGWLWDLDYAKRRQASDRGEGKLLENIASADISRVDLIIRWGGRRRLSGFLQCNHYADFYVVDEYWPGFSHPSHLYDAPATGIKVRNGNPRRIADTPGRSVWGQVCLGLLTRLGTVPTGANDPIGDLSQSGQNDLIWGQIKVLSPRFFHFYFSLLRLLRCA